MSRTLTAARRAVPALLLLLAAGHLLAADVVVLKGGVRIDLKEPWTQQGNTVILTRADGTLLSVPASEIDTKATAAARARKAVPVAAPAVVLPPSTPAEAVRSGKGEKARVKVTDADVGHVEAAAGAAPVDRGAKVDNRAGAARIEVADYNQQKAGDNLVITGTLHNNGTSAALNTRLTVSAVDDTGVSFATASATVANGTVEGGRGVTFSASLPVGERTPSQIRFVPQWQTPPPPAPPAPPAGAGAAPNPAASPAGAPAPARAPAPVTTPYGQGLLYAAPAPPAPNQPPADGKSGYIPGATSPDNQPKPPQ
jgi:pyruvate dehydrogenase E2 component (dihydrolipoyllysine-residue acetyltransferase)